MRCIGHELPHSLLGGFANSEGLLDLGQHRVQRPGQAGDLVPARGLGDAPCQVPRRDACRRVLDLGERPEGATYAEPAEKGAADNDQDADQGGKAQHPLDGGVDPAQRHGDRERGGAVPKLSGNDSPSHLAVDRLHGEEGAVLHARVVESKDRDVRVQLFTAGVDVEGRAAVGRHEPDSVVGGDSTPPAVQELGEDLGGGRDGGRPQVTIGAVHQLPAHHGARGDAGEREGNQEQEHEQGDKAHSQWQCLEPGGDF